MRRANDGPRRDKLLVLLDATGTRAAGPEDAIALYVDRVAEGLDEELVIVCRPRDRGRLQALAPRAVILSGPSALDRGLVRALWRQFQLPRIARRFDVDAVHSAQPPIPLLMARPRVVTVHELTAFGEGEARRPGRWARLRIRLAVRICDEVIASSAELAAALESAAGIAASEILVTPPPTDLDRFAAAHRVAYRAAAALMPVATGPITLPVLDKPADGRD